MNTVRKEGDKTILEIENGNMFSAAVTINPFDREIFIKTEQRSHQGNMTTVINKDGALLIFSTLVALLSEHDDAAGQQLYEKLHNKYGKGATAIDEIVKVFNNPSNEGIGSNAGLIAIHDILRKHKLI